MGVFILLLDTHGLVFPPFQNNLFRKERAIVKSVLGRGLGRGKMRTSRARVQEENTRDQIQEVILPTRHLYCLVCNCECKCKFGLHVVEPWIEDMPS